jgi:hypothetical protein
MNLIVMDMTTLKLIVKHVTLRLTETLKFYTIIKSAASESKFYPYWYYYK